MAGVLTQTTDLLRGMIVRDKLTLDKGSLSSVLVSGRFEARAAKVTGAWPMDRRVIEALISAVGDRREKAQPKNAVREKTLPSKISRVYCQDP